MSIKPSDEIMLPSGAKVVHLEIDTEEACRGLSEDGQLALHMMSDVRRSVCDELLSGIHEVFKDKQPRPHEILHVCGVIAVNAAAMVERRGMPRDVIMSVLRGLGEAYASVYVDVVEQQKLRGEPEGHA